MWMCCARIPATGALEPVAQANLLACLAELIDTRFGGRISKRYLTELQVARTRRPSRVR